MTVEQKVLVVPKNSGLSSGDKRSLRKAGVIVVAVESPHLVRYLSSEPVPMKAHDMLMAAVAGLNTVGVPTGARANAWDAMVKLLRNPEKTA